MLVKVVFLTLLLLSISPNGAESSFIGDIFNMICNICLSSLNTVDDVINSESLKKEAVYICKAILPEGLFEDMCVSIVGGLIHQVYTILESIEPTPTLCYDLRICTNCTSHGPQEVNNHTFGNNHTFHDNYTFGNDRMFMQVPRDLNLIDATKGFEIHTKVFEAVSKLVDLQRAAIHHHRTTVAPL